MLPMKRVLGSLFKRLRSRSAAAPSVANADLRGIVVDATGSTVYGDPTRSHRARPSASIGLATHGGTADADALKIRLARNRHLSDGARVLVERRFAWRGYEVRGISEDPNLRTFVAYREGQIAGTLSVRIDSAKGLSADRHYKLEIDSLRARGGRLSEFTRLAVDDRAYSAKVMGTLIHTAFIYLREVCKCDYAVFEVNPRHTLYYERGLFCERMGPQRMNERVKAPSVLLCMTLQRTAAEAAKCFAGPERPRSSRSAFAHWFPPREAADVLARLRALDYP